MKVRRRRRQGKITTTSILASIEMRPKNLLDPKDSKGYTKTSSVDNKNVRRSSCNETVKTKVRGCRSQRGGER